jgi:hypothetical protein
VSAFERVRGVLGQRQGPLFLLAIGLGVVVPRPDAAAAFLVRTGGGFAVVPLLVGFVGLVLPALLVEVALVASTKHSLPAALGRLGGARGELVGWVALVQAGWVAVWASLSASSGVLIGLAALRQEEPLAVFGSSTAMLISVMPWLLGLLVVRRGRALDWLKLSAATAVVLVIASLLAGLTFPGATPAVRAAVALRPALFLDPRFWVEGVTWAMASAAAGVGLAHAVVGASGKASMGGSRPVSEPRSASVAPLVAGLAVGAILALVSALAGTVSLVPFGEWPAAWLGPATSSWLVRLMAFPGGMWSAWARVVVGLVGATAWAALALAAIGGAIRAKWPSPGNRSLWLPTLCGIAACLYLAVPRPLLSPEIATGGALVGHLLVPWLLGIGLPGTAALLCWMVRRQALALAAVLDPRNRHATRRWLPVLVRWVAPSVGALVLAFQIVGFVKHGLPGDSLVIRGLGRLDEIVPVATGLVWALTTFAASTALTWLRPTSAVPNGLPEVSP